MIDQYNFLEKLRFLVGSSPVTLMKTIRGMPQFISDYRTYQRLNRKPAFRISLRHLFPILTDRHDSAGISSGHYFHQDLWAARQVFLRRPPRHVDIGSRVDGFVTHLLVFMPVTIIDIRDLDSKVTGLNVIRDDATQLQNVPNNSVESLSSLHAAEHFGLGRYSDPVDPDACFQFMSALERALAFGGHLYFSVPVGRERLEFNAHRVFAPQTIVDSFPKLTLVSFCYVGDDGALHENAAMDDAERCNYGCGLFQFTKVTQDFDGDP